MALISLKDVTVTFEGTDAVRDVSFDVNPGDYLVIVGENGSGKTTLMRAMLGLVRPKSGRITFGDGLLRSQIGYLPQQTAAQRDFPASVEEVVLSGCVSRMGARCFYSRQDRQKAGANMRLLDVYPLRRSAYRSLSGGQQQRALLARALCATDSLLLLDEPVTGLDPAAARELYDVVRDLNRNRGVAVVMVSHDVQAALRDATRVLVMNRGVDFLGAPAAYREHFFGKAADENG